MAQSWWRRFTPRTTGSALDAAVRFAAMEAALQALIDAGGGGGASLVHQATKLLTNGQIKAVPTTEVQIAGAPGANKIVRVIEATAYSSIAVGGGYVGLQTPSPFGLKYDGFSVLSWLTDVDDSSLLTIEGGSLDWLMPLVGVSITITGGTNKSLLFATTLEANLTGGHASNTLRVSTEFRVLDVTTGLFLTTTESGWNQTTGLFE